MPVPTSYTEEGLATYMHTVLGPVAAALGFTVAGGSYDEAVAETLLSYGVTDIATVTGADAIAKLRCLARVQAWQLVVNATSGDYDFAAEGASYNRSFLNQAARTNLAACQVDAARYGGDTNAIGLTTIRHADDPYVDDDEDDDA